MNRRKFLTGLALSAGGILVGKELLKKKTYFLPPRGGWHPIPIVYGDPHYSIMFYTNRYGYGDLYVDGKKLCEIENCTGLEWIPIPIHLEVDKPQRIGGEVNILLKDGDQEVKMPLEYYKNAALLKHLAAL